METLREKVLFTVISIVHLITTFCISYYHTEQVTANRDEWTAGKFAVSIVDAMASKFSPIFPRTMLKMASSSTLILVAFLGKISFVIYPNKVTELASHLYQDCCILCLGTTP